MESFESRLRRFVYEDGINLVGTVLFSMQNYVMRELQAAKKDKLYTLIFLGTHAAIQTISVKFFEKSSVEGTKFFLENFVDGSTPDRQFSLIADEIHDLRNTMAHVWFSSSDHEVCFDDVILEGWKRDGNNRLYINPQIYVDEFEKVFTTMRVMNEYRKLPAEQRLKQKYLFILDWLRLEKANPVALEIKKLKTCVDLVQIQAQEVLIQSTISTHYKL